MADASIPVISLHDLPPATRSAAAVQALGEALETFGFVAITEHGVPQPLLTDAYAQARALFEMSPADKERYEDASTGRQRGYTSLGIEHAKGQTVPDLSLIHI